MSESYTNTSLTTARRCLTEYDFRYLQLLEREPDASFDREALAVGECWHKAQEAHARGEDAYAAIAKHAPNELWQVKISRLFAAHGWFWQSQPFKVIEPEREFLVELDGRRFRGKLDLYIEMPDGRRGLVEYKTSGEDVSDTSSYWTRLRMNVQVTLYALALPAQPDFILYDTVRKPTIRPKSIVKKDAERMLAEIAKGGAATYFGETFGEAEIRAAIASEETPAMYGARLTSDIGDDPRKYFARREVPRTIQDYATLRKNLLQQVALLEFARDNGLMHRNPEACDAFQTCEFFALCSNNIRPQIGDAPPDGYRRRDRLHPELSASTEAVS